MFFWDSVYLKELKFYRFSDSLLFELNFLPSIYYLKTFNLLIDPFHATGLFLYPLKILENVWFSNVFSGYRKKPVAWNWQKTLLERLPET